MLARSAVARGVAYAIPSSSENDIADLVDLEWPTVGGATSYRVKWGESTGSYSNTNDVGDVLTYPLVDLTPTMQKGTTYYLRVYSWNGSIETAVDAEIKFFDGLQIA